MKKVEKEQCLIFGEFLKEARVEAGVTQKEIADHCGLTRGQFISNIERGACWPPMNVLVQMSDMYGIPKSKMLTELTKCRKKVWATELGLDQRFKKAK